MPSSPFALALLLVVAFVPAHAAADPAAAAVGQRGEGTCTPGMSSPSESLGGDLFVAWGGMWVYDEANGLAGIQRGDDDATDDACGEWSDAFRFVSYQDAAAHLVNLLA